MIFVRCLLFLFINFCVFGFFFVRVIFLGLYITMNTPLWMPRAFFSSVPGLTSSSRAHKVSAPLKQRHRFILEYQKIRWGKEFQLLLLVAQKLWHVIKQRKVRSAFNSILKPFPENETSIMNTVVLFSIYVYTHYFSTCFF